MSKKHAVMMKLFVRGLNQTGYYLRFDVVKYGEEIDIENIQLQEDDIPRDQFDGFYGTPEVEVEFVTVDGEVSF
ncbi:hypothetical protein CO174_04605 [Candidatus Uhrbacteria bacterium CG_4_9_14_3_um_filter_50_9]|uniref:Uncharacterized protein n=1 Tax=Candidatus Uhrbacteria bacterium CG_4_9_14_3_um_filter_50_9 TaxID=1975035 RepID=A0A2M7XB49_9BACT|nr:MAG: hypothetical protein CO174_04605 [Candidatus Uhrbacteria bacterium CG_4_9_14_3_um_filter_50_9]